MRPKQILLKDCEAGDIVEMQDGERALIVGDGGIVDGEYTSGGLAAVWLPSNGDHVQMCKGIADGMIKGERGSCIVRIVEKLSLPRRRDEPDMSATGDILRAMPGV